MTVPSDPNQEAVENVKAALRSFFESVAYAAPEAIPVQIMQLQERVGDFAAAAYPQPDEGVPDEILEDWDAVGNKKPEADDA